MKMNITAEHIAAVRALVTKDHDTVDALTGGAEEKWLNDLPWVVTAVLVASAQFRFVNAESRPDIIRFVGRSRIRHGGDKAGFRSSTGEALLGAAVGINKHPPGIEDEENSAAHLALLRDLAGEISFQDFERILATVRSELNRMYPDPGAGTDRSAKDSAPARVPAALDPADVLAAVDRVRVQGDAMASRVSALEAQVRDLKAQLDSSLTLGR